MILNPGFSWLYLLNLSPNLVLLLVGFVLFFFFSVLNDLQSHTKTLALGLIVRTRDGNHSLAGCGGPCLSFQHF